MAATVASNKTYVVEHLDPELEEWSALEYQIIANECAASGSHFLLSSVSPKLQLPAGVTLDGVETTEDGVENRFADRKKRICLLDPAAKSELSPEDAHEFDIFLFGGILGDDPPRDRTKELREKGFAGRRLGPVQMTTDTAARVTRIVIQDQVKLEQIPYVDHPEIKISERESTQMPFRYVKDHNGQPTMPKGMLDLIKKDSEKGFGELF